MFTVCVKLFVLLALARLDDISMLARQHKQVLHMDGLKLLLRPETLLIHTPTANALFIALMAIRSIDLYRYALY
jgi:hypothetical protein